MKKLSAILLIVLFLFGCRKGDASLTRAVGLRDRLLSSDGCIFTAQITADYGEKIYTFEMNCSSDRAGDVQFSVVKPESIAGITGSISATQAGLQFDDKVLAFETVVDGLITPVSMPWLVVQALRSGYIASCGMEDQLLRVQIHDSYKEESLQIDLWLNEQDIPVRAQIVWKGSRILSMDIASFAFV